MSPEDTQLIEWAEQRIATIQWWGLLYWTLHNWFALLSWAVAIVVPFGLLITLQQPAPDLRWNTWLLIASALGLLLQVLGTVMRFKERSYRGRRLALKLEGSLLRFRSGASDRDQFLADVDQFLKELPEEEGP